LNVIVGINRCAGIDVVIIICYCSALNVIVVVSNSSAIDVIVVIVIGNCATVDIVIGYRTTLNIVIGINTGIEVGTVAVYCRGTGTYTITGASIVSVNSAGAVASAVSIHQCFRIIATLVN
jgi:hypothetical protein